MIIHVQCGYKVLCPTIGRNHQQCGSLTAREAALSTKVRLRLQLSLLYLTSKSHATVPYRRDRCRVVKCRVQHTNNRTNLDNIKPAYASTIGMK